MHKLLTKYKFLYKVVLLLLILSITLSLRIYFNVKHPIEKRHNYPNHYLNAVSYAVGGLDYNKLKLNPNSYMLSGIDHDTHGVSKVKELDDFLNSRVNTLDIQSIGMYIKGEAQIFELLSDNSFGTFDQFVAAYTWKIFGVSWKNLFYFYSFLSTLAGFGLFLVGRQVTQSYWGGLAVLSVYACATPELYGSVWSIRDTSPVWFFSFAITFFFIYVGNYSKSILNYLSYYLLGLLTLVGIGWRSDALLFFPIITMFLIIKLSRDYTLQKSTLRSTIMYFMLFIFGSYSIMSLDSKLRAPSAPLGVMHIALYGESIRSTIGKYENNFQNQFNDYETLEQVKYYQKHNYPNEKTLELMQGKYGQYCLELYIISLKHNIYQWVKSYPKYFYTHFLLNDTTLSNSNSFQQIQNPIIHSLWKLAVYIAIVGSILLLVLGVYSCTISFFIIFSFYYSIVYWSVLPLTKHIMVMSIPISVLSGIFIFYFLARLRVYILKENVEVPINLKKRLFVSLISIFFMVLIYQLVLYLSMDYSKKKKTDFVQNIMSISKEGRDITSEIAIDYKNEFSLNLSALKPIGIMVEFSTTGDEGILIVHDQYKKWDKVSSIDYNYKITDKSKEHIFFKTCMGFNIEKKYTIKIQLPFGATIQRVKLVPLTNWNGTTYGTTFTKDYISPGAQNVELTNAIKYQYYKKNEASLLLVHLDKNDFSLNTSDRKNDSTILKNIDNNYFLWDSTSNPLLWISQNKISFKKTADAFTIIHTLFKKNDDMLAQDLYLRAEVYDENDKAIYITKLKSLKNDIIEEKDSYEMFFDISDAPKESRKLRIFFYSVSANEYTIPSDIKIFQTTYK